MKPSSSFLLFFFGACLFHLLLANQIVLENESEEEEDVRQNKRSWFVEDHYSMPYLSIPPGGYPKAQGSVWPLPQFIRSSETYLAIRTGEFKFRNLGHDCDILANAFSRYYKLIFSPVRGPAIVLKSKNGNGKKLKDDSNFAGILTSLDVQLENPCEEWPSQEMDEQYILKVKSSSTSNEASLFSQSVWGILRGLETFSQLIHQNENGMFVINETSIRDFPRFPFRGVMLDTSRHYVHKSIIKENLEAMAENKFNVFHWHIVDDQSFPYESSTFPSLSENGAFNPYTHVYTLDDVVEIIEFARLRGIRVIPEFDSPGHTQSWGLGIEDLLTPCGPDSFGPVDPTRESTYKTLQKLFSEIVRVFPDKYVHLGGDEVSFTCWKNNANITAFMKEHHFGDDYGKLEQYYMQRLLDIVKSFPTNNSYIIWQEVIDNGVVVKPDTVVEVWKGGYQKEMATVTSKGYKVLLSACWYLNYISYGVDWPTYYACEPTAFNGTEKQKALVQGGEACMWGEYVDGTNLTPRLWPRAAAVAERLWSAQNVNDSNAAGPRLEEHRCRMLARGIDAQPNNGPSFCNVDHMIQKKEIFQ